MCARGGGGGGGGKGRKREGGEGGIKLHVHVLSTNLMETITSGCLRGTPCTLPELL